MWSYNVLIKWNTILKLSLQQLWEAVSRSNANHQMVMPRRCLEHFFNIFFSILLFVDSSTWSIKKPETYQPMEQPRLVPEKRAFSPECLKPRSRVRSWGWWITLSVPEISGNCFSPHRPIYSLAIPCRPNLLWLISCLPEG